MNDHPRDGRGNRKILVVSFLAWTFTNMDQAFFGYAIPGILAEFDLPLKAVGVIMTLSFLFASILLVAAGHLPDRYGRAPTLSLFLGLSAFFVGLQGLAGGIFLLTLFRSLGFGLSGLLSPITNAYVVENVSPRRRGLAMGVLQCGYPLGWFLASGFAAPLLAIHGWRSMFFAAFLVMPVAAAFYWLLRNAADAPRREAGARREIPMRTLFTPQYRRHSLASIGLHFTFGGAYAGSAFFFPTFFTTTRGYSEADAASLVGLSNGIAIAGYLLAAFVGERLLTRRTVFMFWTASGVASLLGLTWLSGSRLGDTAWYAATAALLYGSMAVLPVLIAELFPVLARARALAVTASAPLALGFAVFPVVVPYVVEALGWEWTFTLLIAPLLCLALISSSFLPNRASGLTLS
ncbi:MAG: MFS transporter [Pseudohaliea sp.]